MENKLVETLSNLSDIRGVYLEKMEKSYNPDTYDFDYIPEEIDMISKEIRESILKNRNELPVDFIIEQLTKLGESPCLLTNDDTGRYAIVCTGMQDVPHSKDEDTEITHWIKSTEWFSTIREALNNYLS